MVNLEPVSGTLGLIEMFISGHREHTHSHTPRTQRKSRQAYEERERDSVLNTTMLQLQ